MRRTFVCVCRRFVFVLQIILCFIYSILSTARWWIRPTSTPYMQHKMNIYPTEYRKSTHTILTHKNLPHFYEINKKIVVRQKKILYIALVKIVEFHSYHFFSFFFFSFNKIGFLFFVFIWSNKFSLNNQKWIK